jgi:type I restriction-modification system DNA methylase subunit
MFTVQERLKFIKEKFDEEIHEVLLKKGKDYGGKIANSNFRDAAGALGLDPKQVWFVYFHKHLSSLKQYLREGQVESEPIEGRLTDLITYLFILWSMLEEERCTQDSPGGG